jgi:DNA polymerase III epsilon subunit-like protein
MIKKINYGLHETIEGSHRTLSDAVTLYAIYYSCWTEILEELSQYYASDEWRDSGYGEDLPRHRELVQRRNHTLREIHEIGKQLRSLGLDVDLCEWANVDDYYENDAKS